ncbi:putative Ubiquitin C-terminal hydrolase 12 [Blattamonas nauphoetae]|uniref:Ubiquitin C-terminal hydrolase 12 n=1 Tax=Blattamonas nauphoetae TaxID=2049346 RepID=A0ABQ9YF45_9EUKA|nr:putative Ubiquitin C-terminal hydrolase 12 [Blattamonas nauphoetae]
MGNDTSTFNENFVALSNKPVHAIVSVPYDDNRSTQSETFECLGVKWRIICSTTNATFFYYLTPGLECCSCRDYSSDIEASFRIVLTLQNTDPQKSVSVETTHKFNRHKHTFWFDNMIRQNKISTKSGFIKDGNVKFRISLTPIQSTTQDSPQSFEKDYKIKHGMIGLENQGATCYLNSLIQSLFHTNIFRLFVYHIPIGEIDEDQSDPSAKPDLVMALQRLLYNLQVSNSSVSTTELTKASHQRPHLPVQHTPLESSFNALFSSRSITSIRCTDVKFVSAHSWPFFDISLPVKGCPDVTSSFERLCEEEVLEGDNAYSTPEHGYQKAKKQTLYLSLPPILHLQLMRWEYDPYTDRMAKVNDRFTFPSRLDLSKFILPIDKDLKTMINKEIEEETLRENNTQTQEDHVDEGTKDDQNQKEDDKDTLNEPQPAQSPSQPASPPSLPPTIQRFVSTLASLQKSVTDVANTSVPSGIYCLHSVLVHSGSISGGHYSVYIRPHLSTAETLPNSNQKPTPTVLTPAEQHYLQSPWYHLNDSNITKVKENDAIKANFGGADSTSATPQQRSNSSTLGNYHSQSSSSAYMLVYLRSDVLPILLTPISSPLIPPHLPASLQAHQTMMSTFTFHILTNSFFTPGGSHLSQGVLPIFPVQLETGHIDRQLVSVVLQRSATVFDLMQSIRQALSWDDRDELKVFRMKRIKQRYPWWDVWRKWKTDPLVRNDLTDLVERHVSNEEKEQVKLEERRNKWDQRDVNLMIIAALVQTHRAADSLFPVLLDPPRSKTSLPPKNEEATPETTDKPSSALSGEATVEDSPVPKRGSVIADTFEKGKEEADLAEMQRNAKRWIERIEDEWRKIPLGSLFFAHHNHLLVEKVDLSERELEEKEKKRASVEMVAIDDKRSEEKKKKKEEKRKQKEEEKKKKREEDEKKGIKQSDSDSKSTSPMLRGPPNRPPSPQRKVSFPLLFVIVRGYDPDTEETSILGRIITSSKSTLSHIAFRLRQLMGEQPDWSKRDVPEVTIDSPSQEILDDLDVFVFDVRVKQRLHPADILWKYIWNTDSGAAQLELIVNWRPRDDEETIQTNDIFSDSALLARDIQAGKETRLNAYQASQKQDYLIWVRLKKRTFLPKAVRSSLDAVVNKEEEHRQMPLTQLAEVVSDPPPKKERILQVACDGRDSYLSFARTVSATVGVPVRNLRLYVINGSSRTAMLIVPSTDQIGSKLDYYFYNPMQRSRGCNVTGVEWAEGEEMIDTVRAIEDEEKARIEEIEYRNIQRQKKKSKEETPKESEPDDKEKKPTQPKPPQPTTRVEIVVRDERSQLRWQWREAALDPTVRFGTLWTKVEEELSKMDWVRDRVHETRRLWMEAKGGLRTKPEDKTETDTADEKPTTEEETKDTEPITLSVEDEKEMDEMISADTQKWRENMKNWIQKEEELKERKQFIREDEKNDFYRDILTKSESELLKLKEKQEEEQKAANEAALKREAERKKLYNAEDDRTAEEIETALNFSISDNSRMPLRSSAAIPEPLPSAHPSPLTSFTITASDQDEIQQRMLAAHQSEYVRPAMPPLTHLLRPSMFYFSASVQDMIVPSPTDLISTLPLYFCRYTIFFDFIPPSQLDVNPFSFRNPFDSLTLKPIAWKDRKEDFMKTKEKDQKKEKDKTASEKKEKEIEKESNPPEILIPIFFTQLKSPTPIFSFQTTVVSLPSILPTDFDANAGVLLPKLLACHEPSLPDPLPPSAITFCTHNTRTINFSYQERRFSHGLYYRKATLEAMHTNEVLHSILVGRKVKRDDDAADLHEWVIQKVKTQAITIE